MGNRRATGLQPADFRPLARLALALLTLLAALLCLPLWMTWLLKPPGGWWSVPLMLLPAVAAAAGWILHVLRKELAALAVAAPALVWALVLMTAFVLQVS